jgi:hypothetical protein
LEGTEGGGGGGGTRIACGFGFAVEASGFEGCGGACADIGLLGVDSELWVIFLRLEDGWVREKDFGSGAAWIGFAGFGFGLDFGGMVRWWFEGDVDASVKDVVKRPEGWKWDE